MMKTPTTSTQDQFILSAFAGSETYYTAVDMAKFGRESHIRDWSDSCASKELVFIIPEYLDLPKDRLASNVVVQIDVRGKSPSEQRKHKMHHA
jgi:hypothetical protein